MNRKLVLFFFFFFLFCLGNAGQGYAQEANTFLSAKKGVMDLTYWDFQEKGPLSLNGEWEFYWHQLRTPQTFHEPALRENPTYINVPFVWNSQQINHQFLSNIGYGTYRLTILLAPKEVHTLKAIYISGVATAYKLWINGECYDSNGTVGTSREKMVAKEYAKVVYFQPTSTTVELVLQVSNFVQRKGGIWDKIQLGNEADIMLMRDEKVAYQSLIFGALSIMGIYHMILYLFRRKDRAPLYLGMICLLISLRDFLLGETLLVRFFPNLDWEIAVKMEYLSVYISVLFILLLVNSIFPGESHLKITRLIITLCALFSGIVLFLPARIYTYTMPVYQIIIVIEFLYVISICFRSLMRKRAGSFLSVAAYPILLLATLNDILYYNHFIFSIDLVPLGVVLCLFLQMVIVAMKFSRAFSDVEILSDQLSKSNRDLDKRVSERTKELKNANVHLQQANERLKQMETSRRHLLANISHELGTPMTAIQGYVKAMKDGIIQQGDPKYISLIYEKTLFVNRLIQDLFELSKLEARQIAFHFVPIRVQPLIQQIYDEFEVDVQEHGLHLVIPEPIPYADTLLQIDFKRIEQVFTNLIYNAIKHTPAGGTISIDVTVTKSKNHVIIQVTDTGSGIEEADLPYLFDRFYKGEKSRKSDSGGTGLGLAIVKEIIETHGGTVGVTSQLNQGSTFYFSLPIRKTPYH